MGTWKKRGVAVFLLGVGSLAAGNLPLSPQAAPGPLVQILIYKGDTPGTGPGMTGFTLRVGEEMTVTVKGVDANGNEVPIWPTWKADEELSVRVVEGRSKVAVVKALKPAAAAFFSAVYLTDDGRKVTGEVGGEIKPAG